MIAPIHTETAVDACARGVRDWVLAERPARLPTERALAAMLGVHRGTLRSALRVLESEGLVVPRQGSGYAVRDYRTHGGPQLLGPLLQKRTDRAERIALLRDLLAVRRALARTLCERLVELHRPMPLDAVQKAIDALDDAVARRASTAEIARLDLGVVSALVDVTDSDVLRLMLNPVRDVLLGAADLVDAMFQRPAENVASWRLLLSLLEALPRRRTASGDAALFQFLATALEKGDDRTLRALSRATR